jgi:hypothetical protein
MHPVVIDQLARLHRAELHRAAEHHRAIAVATRRNRRIRSAAAAGPLARMSARLWRAGVVQAGEAEPCPP